MKCVFLDIKTRLCTVFWICLFFVSCSKSQNSELESLFPKFKLPKISIDDAVKQSRLEMWGHFVDKDDAITYENIVIRFLPDQADPENGMPVMMLIPDDLVLSMHANELNEYDTHLISYGGFYKNGKLKIYKADTYSKDDVSRIKEEDINVFKINEDKYIGFNENSMLILDWTTEDFGHLYGELKYPIEGQPDSTINLSISLYESEKVLPIFLHSFWEADYRCSQRNLDEMKISLTLLPFYIAEDKYRIMVTGSYYEDPFDHQYSSYEDLIRNEVKTFMDENNEFKILNQIPVRWSPKELKVQFKDKKEVKFTREKKLRDTSQVYKIKEGEEIVIDIE